MLSAQERYIAVIGNDMLRKADVIVILEGDNLARLPQGAALYQDGWAPLVVLSGGIDKADYHSIPSSRMLPHLLEIGVPREAVELEEKSMHTRDQAVEITRIARERDWKTIIIVASHYHQYRAYLTFLKRLQEEGLDRQVVLINAPARDLPWFSMDDQQGRRIDVLEGEFERIEKYREMGHIASYESALEYQEWKESQK
ncbi:YdcF family protein [Candidatus Kaiserbacteria bacterium]|nr:YdcF family protein [Candidatus Kaiserbacteria bacterium]